MARKPYRSNSRNKSGHIGVHFLNSSQKWRSEISVSGKSIRLGEFDNLEDAVKARRDAEVLHYGKVLSRAPIFTTSGEERIIKLQLTKGYLSAIDIEDADLADFRWNSREEKCGLVYASRTQRGGDGKLKPIKLHRVILSRILCRELTSNEEVDHVDGDGLNNRRNNLRLSSHQQNMHNRRASKNSSSGIPGVERRKGQKKWRARIAVDGRELSLGSFSDLDSAIQARQNAEIEHFGEFSFTLSRKGSE